MTKLAQLQMLPATNFAAFTTDSRLSDTELIAIKGGNGEEETTEIVTEELIDH